MSETIEERYEKAKEVMEGDIAELFIIHLLDDLMTEREKMKEQLDLVKVNLMTEEPPTNHRLFLIGELIGRDNQSYYYVSLGVVNPYTEKLEIFDEEFCRKYTPVGWIEAFNLTKDFTGSRKRED